MNAKKMEKWVWIFVYAGIVVGGVGLALQRGDSTLGWTLTSLGGASILAGATLIWLRSRIKTDKT